MTPIGTLWSDVNQRQTKVILSVAALNEFELDLRPVSPQAQVSKPAEFTSKFLYGKIPAFEGTDGFKLTEGAVIARYLSSIGTKAKLLGSNTQEAAIIDQWVHFAEHEISTPIYGVVKLIYGLYNVPFGQEAFDEYSGRLFRAVQYLESHLANSPSGYIVLDTLTLADLVVAGTVYSAARIALGSAERAQYPHVFAHYARVTEEEKVKQYLGKDGFVDVRLTEPTKTSWF